MASKLELLVFICIYCLHIAVAATPVFSRSQYTACVVKGATAGTNVTTITATDADGDSVTYGIIDGNTGDFFEINATNGIIKIKTVPSTPSNYTLKCEASSGTPQDQVTVNVTVKVQDSCQGHTNDNGGTGTGTGNQNSNTDTGNQNSNTGTGNQNSNTGTGNLDPSTGTGNLNSNPNDLQNQNETNPDSGNSSERVYGGIFIWMLGTFITALIILY